MLKEVVGTALAFFNIDSFLDKRLQSVQIFPLEISACKFIKDFFLNKEKMKKNVIRMIIVVINTDLAAKLILFLFR